MVLSRAVLADSPRPQLANTFRRRLAVSHPTGRGHGTKARQARDGAGCSGKVGMGATGTNTSKNPGGACALPTHRRVGASYVRPYRDPNRTSDRGRNVFESHHATGAPVVRRDDELRYV